MKGLNVQVSGRALVGIFAAIFIFVGASAFASVPARPALLVGDDAIVLTGVWAEIGGK
jgi:hypothetical protein